MLFDHAGGQGSCIVFCLPNGSYYEQMYYQSSWVEVYGGLGVSLLVWNYSGYGESRGNPSPKQLLADVGRVVVYLQQHFHFSRLGVHGESIGGMVATFAALQHSLSFLMVDRSFSSLGDVIHSHKYLRWLF